MESASGVMSEPARLYALARVTHLEGKLVEAVRAYRRVYYHYPFSDQAEKAESQLNGLRRRLGERYPRAPPGWRLARAEALLGSRKYSRAAPEFARAVAGLSGDDLEHARVRWASADYGRRYTTRAYRRLKPLKVKDSDLAAERLYLMGECARRFKRVKEFRARAEELGEKHPQSKWYEEALFSLGNYYLLKNDTRLSRHYYERVARAFPRGDFAARAHWKVCWRAYLDRDPRARSLFEEHVALYPSSASAAGAIYWAARLDEKVDPARARRLYAALVEYFPHYYYGYRARRRLRDLPAARGRCRRGRSGVSRFIAGGLAGRPPNPRATLRLCCGGERSCMRWVSRKKPPRSCEPATTAGRTRLGSGSSWPNNTPTGVDTISGCG